jgi:hypothetical protein
MYLLLWLCIAAELEPVSADTMIRPCCSACAKTFVWGTPLQGTPLTSAV